MKIFGMGYLKETNDNKKKQKNFARPLQLNVKGVKIQE